MCISSIRIYNNSRYVDIRHFDVFRSVPCGHCLSCQMDKQSEYAMRCYYEWQECLKDGGFAYFNSLTYRDETLPHFYGVPCFEIKDIQAHFKRVRRQLEKKYKIQRDAFRYLVVSEYGHDTHRIHYHVICFVHDKRITLRLWHNIFYKLWYKYYGITDIKKGKRIPQDLEINSTRGLYYVCKYLTKNDPFVDEHMTNINQYLVDNGCDPLPRREFVRRFDNWQVHSLGFGSYALKVENPDFIDQQFITYPTSDCTSKKIKLPYYYKRMRVDNKSVLGLYDIKLVDGQRTWYKTDKQIEFEKRQLEKRFLYKVNTLVNKISSLDGYAKLLENTSFDISGKIAEFRDLYHIDQGSLHDMVYTAIDPCNISDLSFYALDKFGRFCPQMDEDSLSVIEHRARNDGDYFNPLRFDGPYSQDEVFDARQFYASSCESHSPFDDVLKLLAYVDDAVSNYKLLTQLKQNKIKDGLHQSMCQGTYKETESYCRTPSTC